MMTEPFLNTEESSLGSAKANSSPSRGFRVFGWIAFALAAALDTRIVYEQTVLTWQRGPQMLGFTMAHVFPELMLAGAAGMLAIFAWLIIFLFGAVRRKILHRQQFDRLGWVQLLLLAFAAAVPSIPYSFWQFVSLEIAGPGPAATEQLVYAAADDEEKLVKAFVRHGVPVDVPGHYGSTALNAACVQRHVELARYLISRGADVNNAQACRNIAEFKLKMKPAVSSSEPDNGLPKVPGETIHVDGSQQAPSPDTAHP